MRYAKNHLNPLILVIIAMLSTGCASTRVEWNPEKTSTIKQALPVGKPLVKYLVNQPNQATNPILAQLTADKSQQKQADIIAKFFYKMDFSKTVGESLVNEQVFKGIKSDLKQDLNVVINYGLSNDLQIAGVHAAVSFSSHAKKGVLTKCFDEFEFVASSGIDDKPEPFLGRDMRLLNNVFNLNELYASMAKGVAGLIERFYFNWNEINPSEATKPVDILTYDKRLNRGDASVSLGSSVIAYQKSGFQDRLCNSVHIYSFNQKDTDTLEQQANHLLYEKRREASNRKFQYEQQERNRQIMYQRMKTRILNQ